ncbi:MAG: DUF4398 domain-containing protein [Planctomycetota bacterium]|jgi:hypothetical protein
MLAIVGLLLLGGCGPGTSTTRISEATVAIEAARVVDADRFAVYEFVRAVEYLKKAREEEGYSDFQAAINLALDAREFAEKARARALASPERGSETPAAAPAPGPFESPSEADEPNDGVPSGSSL